MTTLVMLLEMLDDLNRDEVIHAAEPWSVDSEALCVDEFDDAPSGLAQLLEVDLVDDVAEVWSAWRGGRRPTPEQLAEAVIHYAQHDAYLPADEEDES